MKLLVLFSVCLALLATAHAARSSTSKGKKPSAAIDETAEILCNVLVQASKELIHDGSVKVNLLKDYLRQDCSKLPKTLNLLQKCQAAVDTYVTDIVEHLQMGTETDKICPLIQGREKPSLTLPLPKSLNITPNQTCVLCEFVIHLLQTFATANSSAQELASILEHICQIMPDVLRAECKGFIEAYGFDIIAILVREFDPPTVCEKVKLCPKQQNVQFLSKPNPNTCGLCDYVETYLSSGFPKEKACQYFSNDNNVRQNCEVLVQLYRPGYCPQLQICHETPVIPPTELSLQSVECSLCKYIVGYVENIIQNNKSAAAVEAALEKVCSIVPGALKDKCDKFVNTYGPIIALLLLKYNDTTQVCNALKVCNNGTEFSLPSLPTVQSVECSLCKYVVGYVENIIQNNKSAAAVEAALEKVCSIVPGALKDKCDKFVNTYGPIIALLLLKYNDTTQVCNALKVCNNGTELSLPSPPHFDLPSVRSVECSLCKYVVGYVENVIQNNKSAAAVEAALEKVCSIVPGALKDKCDKFVNTYGPIIALLLLKYNDTTQVCNALKVCNNGTETPLPDFSHFALPSVKSVECSLCKYVVGYVENVIQNNKSAAAVEAALEKVCSIVPGALKDKCDKFVNTYGPIIALLLLKYNDTTQVCNALKVCNNGTETPLPDFAHFDLPSVKSVECSLCKYVVGYVENIIQNNKSAAAVEAALEKVCSIVPGALKDKCDKFVNTYGPIIALLLLKYNDTTQVCNALKVCNNGTELALPHVDLANVKSAECALCKYIISYVDTVIQNNSSQAAIDAALEKVCTILPATLKDKCKTFVDTYGPILAKLLANHTTPEKVCDAIKICNNGTQALVPVMAVPKLSSATVKSAECALCKYIVSYVDSVIQSNKSAAAIDAALEKVCTILPAPVKDKCKKFVDNYGPILAQLLVKYTTPEQVCDALKVCNNGTVVLQPVTENVSTSRKVQKRSIAPLPAISASPECALCKYIISYVDTVIQNNSSQAAIDAALEKVCTILPATLKDKCKTFVDTYGPILAKLLANHTTPEKVCDAIKICNNGTVSITPIATPTVAGVECSLCKYVVGYIEHVVESNKTEAAVDAALEKVCTILPSDLKDKCKTFVDTYGPLLFQLLQKFGTADAVCKALKLCLKETEPISPALVFPTIDASAIKSAECALCKYIISYVDSVIQNNSSQAAIDAALEKVCTILPAPLKDKCKTFVDTYGPILAKLLANHTTPEKVCDAIKLCNNGTVVLRPVTENVSASRKVQKRSIAPLQAVGASPECALCKYVVSYVDSVIQNNKSEAAIDAALEKVCTILPAALKDRCKVFVDTYGPILAQLLLKYATPDQVCNAMKLCNNGTVVLQPVTENISAPPTVQKQPVAPLLAVSASPECALCKYVISYLDSVIQNNKSEAAIEAALDQVCKILPGALQDKCKQFVVIYGPVIPQLLIHYGTPDQVCNALSLCNNGTQKAAVRSPREIVQSLKKPVGNDVECSLCKYVLNYINVLVSSNASAKEIEKALELVCGILPSADHKKCDTFVQQYGPVLAQLVAELDDPNVVCQWLSLCTKSAGQIIEIPVVKKGLKTLPCNLCQYVVNYLDVIVKANSTETDFEKALDQVCDILPGKGLQGECQTLVNLFGPAMINFLVEHADPKTVCQTLGICDK